MSNFEQAKKGLAIADMRFEISEEDRKALPLAPLRGSLGKKKKQSPFRARLDSRTGGQGVKRRMLNFKF